MKHYRRKNHKDKKIYCKPYTGSKRFDITCRSNGGCPYCESSRLRYKILGKLNQKEQEKELLNDE